MADDEPVPDPSIDDPSIDDPIDEQDDERRKAAGAFWPGAATAGGAALGGVAAGGVVAHELVGSAPQAEAAGLAAPMAEPASGSSPPTIVHGSPPTTVHGSPPTTVHGSPPTTVHGSPPTTVLTSSPPAGAGGRGRMVVAAAAGVAAVAAAVVGVVVLGGGGDDSASVATVAGVEPTQPSLVTAPPADRSTATGPAQTNPTPTSPVTTSPPTVPPTTVTPTTVTESTSPASTSPAATTLPTGAIDGTVDFAISGDVSAAGQLIVLQTLPNAFDGTGWLVVFGDPADPSTVLQVATVDGTFVATYSDGEVIVGGSEDVGCAVDLVRNDESGFTGSFDCSGVPGLRGMTTPIFVDFNATFDASV